jgi:O-antigen biosynthesis protein
MRFYVNTFPRSGSAGVRALYKLVDELVARGVQAEAGPVGMGPRDWINVYPEIVAGNPSGAQMVVRWVLAPPRGPVEWGPDDLVMRWVGPTWPDGDRLLVDLIEPGLFYPKATPGVGTLVWVGKGNSGGTEWTGGVITLDHPADRLQLADWLRAADLVYSYDGFSMLNVEAAICGTPVLFDPSVTRYGETIFGELGWAYSPEELPEARREVRWAADHYQSVRETIAGDVDHLLELCGERWGLEVVEPGGKGVFLHG